MIKKLLLSGIFMFFILATIVLANVVVDSQFVDSNGNEIGIILTVEQGDIVPYSIWVSADEGEILSYTVYKRFNGVNEDIIPHTVIQGSECQDNISNYCEYFQIKELDTSSFEIGNHEIFISGNDASNENYKVTENLFLIVEEKVVVPNNPPNNPFDPYPLNNQVDVPRNVELSWKASDPDGDTLTYDVYFGTGQILERVANGISDMSHQLNDLDYDTEYSWKVVANDGEFENPSSDVWKFTTEEEVIVNNPPNEPYSPTPYDNQIGVSRTVELFWKASDPDGDTLTYDVYFGTSSDMIKVADNINDKNLKLIGSLNYDTIYYWKVVANDGEFENLNSAVWKFTTEEENIITNNPPNAPYNPIPYDNQVDVFRYVLLSWKATDPDGDDLTFDVYFGTDQTLLTKVANDITLKSYYLPDLDFNTEYYWRVISNDGKLQTSSDIWKFTTEEDGNVVTNNDPVLDDINDVRAKCNSRFRLNVDATDEDGDTLIYSDNTNLFNIDSQTGEISFTPSCSDRGVYDITITVRDNKGGIDTESFELKIFKSSNGNDDEDGTLIDFVISKTECDLYGYRFVTYNTIDISNSKVVNQFVVKEICSLSEFDEDTFLFNEKNSDKELIFIVTLIFLVITVPISIWIYRKLA